MVPLQSSVRAAPAGTIRILVKSNRARIDRMDIWASSHRNLFHGTSQSRRSRGTMPPALPARQTGRIADSDLDRARRVEARVFVAYRDRRAARACLQPVRGPVPHRVGDDARAGDPVVEAVVG